jgi:UDP-N-acetylmuramoylalanine--D-glutamate ligase
MDIKNLQNKLVAILGYGQEGNAVTSYLIKHGVKPVLFDQRPWQEWPAEEQEAIKKLGVNFIFGPDSFLELKGFDIVFRSPGVPLSKVKGQLSKVVLITSQTKWFFDHCPCKIIGVTGTKGKGTTASLIYDELKCSQPIHRLTTNINQQPINGLTTLGNIYLTGNIGKTQPLEILDDLSADDYVVYELSSFQLQDLDKSPHIAVVLMVTSEHLDYHASQEEYIEAKSAITKFQTADDFAVINPDFENSIKIGQQGEGEKIYFSRNRELENGCFVKNDSIIFVGAGLKPAPTEAIIKISDLQLKGAHNLENVCAAVGVGKILGVSDEAIRKAITNFKGLKHRLEFVAEKQGLKFYNDSFSTTPETAIAAIQSFDEPLVVILGGSSKNSDFSGLGKVISNSKNIKAVILIGQEASRIRQALKIEPAMIIEGAKSMVEIFGQIKSVASKGDVVLLSPACASFGLFKNYKDRGEQFRDFVKSFK